MFKATITKQDNYSKISKVKTKIKSIRVSILIGLRLITTLIFYKKRILFIFLITLRIWIISRKHPKRKIG